MDQLDQAALRDDEEEEEDNYNDEDHHPEQLPQQQQQDDWDDSDREEIDVPNASDQFSPPSKTKTIKKTNYDDDDEERETVGLDELFASKSSSTTAKAQAADLQELPYTRLYQAWARESRSPELLPLDQVTVEALREAIADVDPDEPEHHHHHHHNYNSNQNNNPHMTALLQSLRHIDAQRVKFVLADLLKLRLQKIQAHPLHMRTLTDRMSQAEVCVCC